MTIGPPPLRHMRAGIGISDHSGWAVLIAVGGDQAAPRLLMRRRLQLIDGQLPRQVYHAVAEQGRPRSLIPEVLASAATESTRELAQATAELREAGYVVTRIAVAGKPGPAPSLERILASHALLHGAEGHLYRDALAEAAADFGLAVTRFIAKELAFVAAGAIGLTSEAINDHIAVIGKAAGPPWTQDQKRAAMAAWMALAAG